MPLPARRRHEVVGQCLENLPGQGLRTAIAIVNKIPERLHFMPGREGFIERPGQIECIEQRRGYAQTLEECAFKIGIARQPVRHGTDPARRSRQCFQPGRIGLRAVVSHRYGRRKSIPAYATPFQTASRWPVPLAVGAPSAYPQGMCGRFTQTLAWPDLVALYGLTAADESVEAVRPRYNIAPTQPILIVGAQRTAFHALWDFHPSWMTEPPAARRPLINARLESLEENKPMFRGALRHGRCLVPAGGWYEWQGERAPKQPHYLTGEAPLAFAGLWSDNETVGGPTAAIVTCPAATPIRHLHHRMPAILGTTLWDAWLDPELPREATLDLLRTAPIPEIAHHRVGQAVNAPRNDGPDLLTPIDEPPQQAALL